MVARGNVVPIRKQKVKQKMSENLPAVLSKEEQELIELAKLNKGFERDELTVPFLKIMQPLSPYVQEGEPQYVNGLKPGMFFNTASNKMNDGKTGIIVAVINHQKSYTEWVPRASGGGLVKDWGEDEGWKSKCEGYQKTAYQPITQDGHNIVIARAFTIFNIDPETGTYDPSMMMFKATDLKVARHWSTLLNQDYITLSNGQRILAPHYYFCYLLTTEQQRNNQGTWFQSRIKQYYKDNKRVRLQDMPNGQQIWEDAKQFQKSMAEGTIRSATPEMYGEQNDEIPF